MGFSREHKSYSDNMGFSREEDLWHYISTPCTQFSHVASAYIGPMDALRALARFLARVCSLVSARSVASATLFWACLYLARLRAAISSASSICFLYDLILPCSWSMSACILSWFFLSSSCW